MASDPACSGMCVHVCNAVLDSFVHHHTQGSVCWSRCGWFWLFMCFFGVVHAHALACTSIHECTQNKCTQGQAIHWEMLLALLALQALGMIIYTAWYTGVVWRHNARQLLPDATNYLKNNDQPYVAPHVVLR